MSWRAICANSDELGQLSLPQVSDEYRDTVSGRPLVHSARLEFGSTTVSSGTIETRGGNDVIVDNGRFTVPLQLEVWLGRSSSDTQINSAINSFIQINSHYVWSQNRTWQFDRHSTEASSDNNWEFIQNGVCAQPSVVAASPNRKVCITMTVVKGMTVQLTTLISWIYWVCVNNVATKTLSGSFSDIFTVRTQQQTTIKRNGN